ncbi:MAG: prepilin-type N-terminal cleavage/methylation domain-containing protein [Planctomycetota bacterium]|jgi:prepilin-type N-terminal cleavage/methylation domain-containing protein
MELRLSELMMQNMRQYNNKHGRNGFTLVELIIVVVILSIAALMAVPMVSSAADMQVRSAANQIAAHLDYAKSMAITHQQSHSVVFDVSNEIYQVQDAVGNLIDHPVNPGSFVVDFSNTELDKVDITSADFDGDITRAITFDYLGSPYSGTDTTTPLNSGQIILQANDFSITVSVEPITGYVTISGL